MEFRSRRASLACQCGIAMTTGHDGQENYRRRGIALMAFAALGIAGCTTTNLEDVAPQAAAVEEPAQAESAVLLPQATASGAPSSDDGAVDAAGQPSGEGEMKRSGRDTGQYPNLNIVPVPAAPQLTSSDRKEKFAELDAALNKAKRIAALKAESHEAALKKLAETHAADALKQIEGN